jgi:hypothetical protein
VLTPEAAFAVGNGAGGNKKGKRHANKGRDMSANARFCKNYAT